MCCTSAAYNCNIALHHNGHRVRFPHRDQLRSVFWFGSRLIWRWYTCTCTCIVYASAPRLCLCCRFSGSLKSGSAKRISKAQREDLTLRPQKRRRKKKMMRARATRRAAMEQPMAIRRRSDRSQDRQPAKQTDRQFFRLPVPVSMMLIANIRIVK